LQCDSTHAVICDASVDPALLKLDRARQELK
jgi:hypothetical protein